jgi:hypothetical protein
MDQQLKQQRTVALAVIAIVAIGIYLLYNHFYNAPQFVPKETSSEFYQQPVQELSTTPDTYRVNNQLPDKSEVDPMVDVQILFAKNGYQYCEFYDEYKWWEAQANKMDDDYYQKHPDAPGVGSRKADKWLDMKVSRWLKKHHLPDSIGTTISMYGAKVCH